MAELAIPTAADVLNAAADLVERTHAAARITAPIVLVAVGEVARETATDVLHESELAKAARDALDAHLPADFLHSWTRPLATADVLDALREAARAEQIIRAKQQCRPARLEPVAAHPADVYADEEYFLERAEVNV